MYGIGDFDLCAWNVFQWSENEDKICIHVHQRASPLMIKALFVVLFIQERDHNLHS